MALEQYRSGSLAARQANKFAASVDAQASVAIAKLAAIHQVQCAKVDAAGSVTQRALTGAAFVTHVEQTLAMSQPAASGRLAQIADLGALALSQIVMDTVSDLRQV